MADGRQQRIAIDDNPVPQDDNAPNPPGYQAQHFPPAPNDQQPGFIPAQFPGAPGNQNPPPQQQPAANRNAPAPQQQPIVVHQYPPVRYMPSRYDRNASKFDGKPASLRRFFEDIEALANDCVLSQHEQITHTLRYLEGDDYDVWSTHPSAQGNDWDLFKQEIMAIYPGSEDNSRFSITDLELFVENHAAIPMQTRDQFGEYYRNFLTHSGWLLNRNIISHRERNKLFMNGFHISFRQQLRTQLRLQDPRHALDEPWDIANVEQAARFLLEANGNANIFTITSPAPITHSPAPNALYPSSPRQTFDMTSLEQFLTSDSFLNRLADKMTTTARNHPQPSYQRNSQQPSSQRQPTWPCGFCSDTDHMFRICQKLDDYIRRGICIRDNTNRICMPDGTLVTHQIAPGRNMMERIDNWHKTHNSSTSQALANIIEVVPRRTEDPPTIHHTTLALKQEEEELERLEAVALATARRQDEIRKKIGNVQKGKNAPNATNTGPQRPSTPVPPPAPPANMAPQYRFSSAIEDPKAVQDVIQRSLEGTVTLTQRELYAIAPDVRKHIKEQVTTHRVPAGPVSNTSYIEESGPETSVLSNHNYQHSQSSPNRIVVANNIEELRTIPLELDGRYMVDAILDEGSQIIGIRQDVWERLGLPLLKDQNMVMESANATKDTTLGLLRDLPVRIGNSTFYLQVQVFENAPYEMLLGRPFLTLTQAQTHHYSNGDSHITLLDPNTNESFTIPTAARVRSAVPRNTGF